MRRLALLVSLYGLGLLISCEDDAAYKQGPSTFQNDTLDGAAGAVGNVDAATDAPGTGGMRGTGGIIATGGTPGTGGTSGAAGTAASGGASGSGGTNADAATHGCRISDGAPRALNLPGPVAVAYSAGRPLVGQGEIAMADVRFVGESATKSGSK